LRCSRPLCSSQATGGDPPKPAPTPTTRSGSTAGEPRKHPQRVPVKVRDEKRPFPQDPTACQAAPPHERRPPRRLHKGASSTTNVAKRDGQLVDVPPMSSTPSAYGSSVGLDAATR